LEARRWSYSVRCVWLAVLELRSSRPSFAPQAPPTRVASAASVSPLPEAFCPCKRYLKQNRRDRVDMLVPCHRTCSLGATHFTASALAMFLLLSAFSFCWPLVGALSRITRSSAFRLRSASSTARGLSACCDFYFPSTNVDLSDAYSITVPRGLSLSSCPAARPVVPLGRSRRCRASRAC